jgi:hypothetical protein
MNEQFKNSTTLMPNLQGLLFRMPFAPYWIAAGVVAVCLGYWIAARHFSLSPAMGYMLFGGLLVSFHASPPDLMFLLPLLLATADDIGAPKAMIVVGLTGLASLSLATPTIAFIGQLSLVALFALVFYESRRNQRFGKMHIHVHREI